MLIDPMTVAENIVLGNEPHGWFDTTVDRECTRQKVIGPSNQYEFDVDPDDAIEDVNVDVQRRVEILKAPYRRTDILILGEPAAAFIPQEVEELFHVFGELTAQDKTIIFVSHRLGETMYTTDGITVLRNGENVGTVETGEMLNKELVELMVSREVPPGPRAESQGLGGEVPSVRRLSTAGNHGVPVVSDVSFDIREGEALGIAGVDGSGQSQLVEVITGLRTPIGDSVSYKGQDIADASRRSRINDGMAYVPEGRRRHGLVMGFDLAQDGILGNQRSPPFAAAGQVHWSDVRKHTERIIDEYDV